MPEILAGASEGAIQTWLVAAGADVAVGQGLAEIETDKAVVELTAEAAGTVGRLLVSEGDSVAVGDAILVLLGEGEGMDAIGPAFDAVGVAAESDEASSVEPAPSVPYPPVVAAYSGAPGTATAEQPGDSARRLFASPLVRRLAIQEGVSLSDVRGTGPQGRIVRRDLERHLADREGVRASTVPRDVQAVESRVAPPDVVHAAVVETGEFEDVPVDRMRRAIARRLTESKSSVPHFYLVADCSVDALLELRRAVNDGAPRKISVNDFVLKAVAGALIDVPAANAVWQGETIRRFFSADISVAVATDGGLTTPVLRGVERLSLSEISETVAELAGRAREGRLRQHELEGGSFSVSNLGMYGTSEFSAILNPPQSGILAVGAARAMPVVDANGDLAVGRVMTVTLSADHRVVDGAVAAKWLAAFQKRIENPLTILI